MITFTMEFDAQGKAVIRLPEGRSQQADAGKVADLTDRLSKMLGKVEERHIGDHHHHVHGDAGHQHHHNQEAA